MNGATPGLGGGRDVAEGDQLIGAARLAVQQLDDRIAPPGTVIPGGVGELEIDVAARRVRLAGNEVALRAKEFDLLARLAVDAGAAVSRAELMSDVWDEHWFGSTKTLDVHLSTLRRRLAEAAEATGVAGPEIVTLRGRGFRLDGPATGPATR